MKLEVSSDNSLPLWAIKTEVIAMVPCPLRSPPSQSGRCGDGDGGFSGYKCFDEDDILTGDVGWKEINHVQAEGYLAGSWLDLGLRIRG